jgi:dGTPase
MAQVLGLNDCLAEAICLGHDVGHTPFGHVGERTIKALLEGVTVWDSNAHSLRVLEELEQQYPRFDGLDLTWATREGIARHMTVFDVPSAEHGDDVYGQYQAPSLECQVGNAADEIAYLSHDVHDALQYHILAPRDLDALGLSLWKKNWTIANAEWAQVYPEGRDGVEKSAVLYRRVHGLMIADMVADVLDGLTTNGIENNGTVEREVNARVRDLCARFPIYQG